MQLSNNMTVGMFTNISADTIDNIKDEDIKREMLQSNTANAHKSRYPEQFNPPPFIIENMAITARKAEPVAEQMIDMGFGWDMTSGYRCPKLNKDVGGVANSAHVLAQALDIRFKSPEHAFALVRAFIKAGFKRIGLGSTFIHADWSTELPTPKVWQYSNKYKTPAWLLAKADEFLNEIKAIQPAQVVTPAPVTPPVPPAPAKPSIPTHKTVKVGAGEGPYQVAKRAGVNINTLVKLNPAKFPKGLTAGSYMLYPGDLLFIE